MSSLLKGFLLLTWLGCANCVQNSALSISSTGPFTGLESWVALDFNLVDTPTRRHDCWLGVFPAVANLSTAPWPQVNGGTSGNVPNTVNSPMKWIDCKDADASFMKTGSGHLDIRLLNVRQDLVIAMFTNGSKYPVLQGTTPAISFSDYRLPMHGRIALASEEGRMLVQWTSLAAAAPTLQWSYQRSGAPFSNSVAASSSSKYGIEDLCGSPANREGFMDSGFHHVSAVTWPPNAEPGNRIFYRFGSATEDLWSEERSFQIPPRVGPNTSTYMVVVADVGASEPDNFQSHWSNPLAGISGSEVLSNLTRKRMQDAPQSHAVLDIGDISYATGFLAKWDLLMHQIDDVASRTPYMVSQGNHERDWPGTGSAGYTDSGGECGVPASTLFRMPTPSLKQELTWYSFDMGAIHVVMMDTEVLCGKGSEQLAWLQADLEAVDRSRTPWVVVTGHRPMYAVGSGGSRGPDLSNSFCPGAESSGLETLFKAHEVDLCLWGHVHNALATCPVYNGKCVTQPTVSTTRAGYRYLAPVHAVVGNGGMDLSGIASKPAPWVAWQANVWGWNVLTAAGSESLKLTFYSESNATLYEISVATPALDEAAFV